MNETDHAPVAGTSGMNTSNHYGNHTMIAHRLTADHNLTLFQGNGTTTADMDKDEVLSPLAAVLILYSVIFLMLGFQMGLVIWKQRHKRSYELVTLVGLWLMPCIISLQLHFYRFLIVWLLFTLITLHLLSLCLVKKLHSSTPRKVYTFFMAVYKVSKGVGIAGYVMMLSEVLGLGPVLRLILPRDAAIDLLWYGLYFGILGRDCAEVAADRMAAGLSAVGGGGGRALVSTINACGVCGNHLNDYSHMGEAPADEKVAQLSCKHCFHDLCIRGWTMVGKKDMCPVCNEKVDLRSFFADRPWETRNLTWIQMLDGVRYLVVWNPIIFMVLSVLFHFFAPHHHHHHAGHPGGPALALGQNMTHPAPLLQLHGH